MEDEMQASAQADANGASRRSVLAGLGLAAAPLAIGLGAGPLTAALGEDDLDVVIIGGGAAGIGAALTLPPNRRWKIYEASTRVGGRALTDRQVFGPDIPFDIGCAWIHGATDDSNLMAAKLRQLGWAFHDCKDLGLDELYYGCGFRADAAFLKDEHDAHAAMEKKLEDIGKTQDVPADRVVQTWRQPADAVATAIGPMDAAVDFADVSTAEMHAIGDYAPNYLVKQGYGALVEQIATAIPLDRWRFDTHVTEIETTRDGVLVRTANRLGVSRGVTRAKAAIVTVSTGVLARGAIRFKPGLPDAYQKAIEGLPMGLLTKIPMLVPGIRQAFGSLSPPIGSFGSLMMERPDNRNLYFLACPWDTDLMVGFVGGDFAWEMSRAGDKALIDFAQQRLGELFGCGMQKAASKAMVTPWATDPLTLGAYSAARPGHFKAREVLRTPIDERIYFAGEATATSGWFATCHGAFRAGIDAARSASKAFSPR